MDSCIHQSSPLGTICCDAVERAGSNKSWSTYLFTLLVSK